MSTLVLTQHNPPEVAPAPATLKPVLLQPQGSDCENMPAHGDAHGGTRRSSPTAQSTGTAVAAPVQSTASGQSQGNGNVRTACVRTKGGQVHRIRVSFHPDSDTISLIAIAPATPSTATADAAGPYRRMPEGPGTPKSGRGSCSLEEGSAGGDGSGVTPRKRGRPESAARGGAVSKRGGKKKNGLHNYVCKRKPLGQCTREEWLTDFRAFTKVYKGGMLARDLQNKVYMCNRTPLDVYGLYSEVCKCGGFREGTHINWSGKIFPALENYTPGNNCTSVGSQLIQQYRQLLLDYEQLHPEDVAEDICSMCDGGNEVSKEWVCCEMCEAWMHLSCDPRPDLGRFSDYVRNRRKYVCLTCSPTSTSGSDGATHKE